MTFTQSVGTCFKKYAIFRGRAARSEFWWWFLFITLGDFMVELFDNAIFDIPIDEYEWGPFFILFTLVTFLPHIAVAARRFHDTNRSGWWVLYWLLIMGAVVFAGFPFTLYVRDAGPIWVLVAIGIVICFIWQIIWLASKGTQGDNRFGADPLAPQV